MKISPKEEQRILLNREATKRPLSGPNSLSVRATAAMQQRRYGNHLVGYQADASRLPIRPKKK